MRLPQRSWYILYLTLVPMDAKLVFLETRHIPVGTGTVEGKYSYICYRYLVVAGSAGRLVAVHRHNPGPQLSLKRKSDGKCTKEALEVAHVDGRTF